MLYDVCIWRKIAKETQGKSLKTRVYLTQLSKAIKLMTVAHDKFFLNKEE